MQYIVYGKRKTDKRYRAFDINRGLFVGNLIYATFFTKKQLPTLEKHVKHMNDNNLEFEFEIRKHRS